MTAIRGLKIERKCKCCGGLFLARAADVKRGWAKFCSKSCKAIRQEQRTGATASFRYREQCRNEGVGYGAQFHPRTGEFEGYHADHSEGYDNNKD